LRYFKNRQIVKNKPMKIRNGILNMSPINTGTGAINIMIIHFKKFIIKDNI